MFATAITVLGLANLSVVEAVRVDKGDNHFRMVIATAGPVEPSEVSATIDSGANMLRLKVPGASITKNGTRHFIDDDGYDVQASPLKDRARLVGASFSARLNRSAGCTVAPAKALPDGGGLMVEVVCPAVAPKEAGADRQATADHEESGAPAAAAIAGHPEGKGHGKESSEKHDKGSHGHDKEAPSHDQADQGAAPGKHSDEKAHKERAATPPDEAPGPEDHDAAHKDAKHPAPDTSAGTPHEGHGDTDPTTNFGLSMIAPILLLAALAVGAFIFARRKRGATGWLEVMETASIGPRRQLIVARFQNEILVLGSTDGGISLLAVRGVNTGAEDAAFDTSGAVPAGDTANSAAMFSSSVDAALQGLADRMGTGTAVANASVDIDDSVEDRELRRKLAEGLGGRS